MTTNSRAIRRGILGPSAGGAALRAAPPAPRSHQGVLRHSPIPSRGEDYLAHWASWYCGLPG
eukprot:10416255-Alexandrium_andersonii.AAC.1